MADNPFDSPYAKFQDLSWQDKFKDKEGNVDLWSKYLEFQKVASKDPRWGAAGEDTRRLALQKIVGVENPYELIRHEGFGGLEENKQMQVFNAVVEGDERWDAIPLERKHFYRAKVIESMREGYLQKYQPEAAEEQPEEQVLPPDPEQAQMGALELSTLDRVPDALRYGLGGTEQAFGGLAKYASTLDDQALAAFRKFGSDGPWGFGKYLPETLEREPEPGRAQLSLEQFGEDLMTSGAEKMRRYDRRRKTLDSLSAALDEPGDTLLQLLEQGGPTASFWGAGLLAFPVLGPLGAGVVMRAMEGGMEAGQTMEEARKAGMDEQEAIHAANLTALGNAPLAALDAAQMGLIMRGLPAPVRDAVLRLPQHWAGHLTSGALGWISQGFIEGGEEGLQSEIQSWAMGHGFNPNPAEWDKEATTMGTIMGLAMGAPVAVTQTAGAVGEELAGRRMERAREEIAADEQAEVDEAARQVLEATESEIGPAFVGREVDGGVTFAPVDDTVAPLGAPDEVREHFDSLSDEQQAEIMGAANQLMSERAAAQMERYGLAPEQVGEFPQNELDQIGLESFTEAYEGYLETAGIEAPGAAEPAVEEEVAEDVEEEPAAVTDLIEGQVAPEVEEEFKSRTVDLGDGSVVVLTKNTIPEEGAWRITHLENGEPSEHEDFATLDEANLRMTMYENLESQIVEEEVEKEPEVKIPKAPKVRKDRQGKLNGLTLAEHISDHELLTAEAPDEADIASTAGVEIEEAREFLQSAKFHGWFPLRWTQEFEYAYGRKHKSAAELAKFINEAAGLKGDKRVDADVGRFISDIAETTPIDERGRRGEDRLPEGLEGRAYELARRAPDWLKNEPRVLR
jgi:hypothetical protein